MKTLLHKLMAAGLMLPGLVLARPGDIDTGAGPLPVLPIVRPDGSLYQIVPDASAGILSSRRVVAWNARATGGPLGQFEFSNPFGSSLWKIYDPVLLLANGDLLIPAVGPMGGTVPGALVSHLMRVRPDGLRDPGFGSGGVVSLDDESPEAPPRTKRVIAGLRELPDGRILVLESLWNCGLDRLDFGTYEGRTDGWDFCYYMASSVVRLLGDGRLDTTFGTGGRTRLVSNLGPVMFEARADGGAVIANGNGVVQVLDASGRMATVRELGKRIRAMLQQRDGRWLIIRDLDIQRGHVAIRASPRRPAAGFLVRHGRGSRSPARDSPCATLERGGCRGYGGVVRGRDPGLCGDGTDCRNRHSRWVSRTVQVYRRCQIPARTTVRARRFLRQGRVQLSDP